MEGLALSLAVDGKGSLSIQNLRSEVLSRFQSRILSHVDAEEWEGKVRTSLFFNRDGSGNYSFIHQSFRDYFLARAALRAIRAQDFTSLKQKGFGTEAGQFFHEMMLEEDLESLYLMLSCRENVDAADLAGQLILERKLPVPFGKDSTHIPRLIRMIRKKGFGAGFNACLWTFEQLKVGEAIPELIARLEEHPAESTQEQALVAIANIGDSRALPELQRLLVKLLHELMEFHDEFGPTYERIGEQKTRDDNAQLVDHWQEGPMEDRFLGSIVLARVNVSADKYHMWGYTVRDLDEAMAAIGERRPVRQLSLHTQFWRARGRWPAAPRDLQL